MKKRFTIIDWLLFFIVFSFSLNIIVHVFLYVEEQNIYDLFQMILCSFCLIVIVVPWIIKKVYRHYLYIIIYNDFFEIYDKSIFNSLFICERENKKYLKYGLTSTCEQIYEYSYNDLIIDFGLIRIDDNRKLMIIYKFRNFKNFQNGFNEAFLKSQIQAIEHYYENNVISPLAGETTFYKNKRNAFQVKKVDGGFVAAKYRHDIPVVIHSIKALPNYEIGWKYIGDSYQNGLEYFESYEKAKEYIMSLIDHKQKMFSLMVKIKRLEKYNYFILLPSQLYNKIYVTICYH